MFDLGRGVMEDINGDEIQEKKPEKIKKTDDYLLAEPEKSTLSLLQEGLYGPDHQMKTITYL